MEDYNKIIESLSVRYNKSKNVKIIQPLTITNFYDVDNSIFLLNKGTLRYEGEEVLEVKEGEMLFVPGGKMLTITYGGDKPTVMTNDEYISKKDDFLKSFHFHEKDEIYSDNFSYVTFGAKIFDSVNFFGSLDIPPFIMKNTPELNKIFRTIQEEAESKMEGAERIVKINTDYLVIETIRYIIRNKLFVERLATNSTYFKDPRLIDIFAFIKENLSGDLSNKILAEVANVSEDYVGQYFKMLTGINPQDYIEYQRMEKAVSLLRTSKKSIREIGHDVGYKDTAYFCRRFKMMFGIPAGKMRRRESLMNV